MMTKNILALFCLGTLPFGAFAQSLTNKPIFAAQSIKVITNEKFPADMECELFVGPKGIPYFRTEGKENQVDKFTIDCVGSGPAISMLRREGSTNSYVLSLFTEDSEGKVLMFLDFNFDGIWDVKRTPTRKQDFFIFFKDQWFEVDKIEGLLTKTPTAVASGKQYVFDRSWFASH